MNATKRLLLAVGLLAAAIGIGIAIYFVFFRIPTEALPERPGEPALPVTGLPEARPGAPARPGEAPAPGIPTAPALPEVAAGGLTRTALLSSGPVRGATLMADGRTLAYYDRTDGRFYRLIDGQAERLSNQQFFEVQNVVWSPDASRAVLEYPDGANITVDFSSGQQSTLPKHWEDFDFSPQGSEIIAKSIGLDPSNRWLVTSAPDGSRTKIIAPLGENEQAVTVAWSPQDEVVAFSATGSALGLDRTEVFAIGKNKENFRSLIVEGRDFRPLWSPDGERLLYSAYDESSGLRPMLWVTTGRSSNLGEGRRRLGLATWADKCAFAEATLVYCAVPRDMPEGYGLQPALRRELNDQIFRLDIAAGAAGLIGEPDEPASMENLLVSPDGAYLYYVDGRTGTLRQMRLR